MGSRVGSARRRGRSEGSIYKDEAKGRWYGAVSIGYGTDGQTWRRHKVSGRTRAEVAGKLKQLQAEQDSGVQPEHGYTVQRAVDDWLADGLDGRSAGTVTLYRNTLKPVSAVIGKIELRMLTAQDVRRALVRLAAASSSRTVTIAHNALTRALRHAEANRHVVHNVAALVDTPKGQSGRPSKALTADQAAAVLRAAGASRLGAYVILCLMTGIRTEEARALRWDHVNLDAGSIAVWRSVRLGGDTKTSKSRRTLGLPQAVTEALREHRARQDGEKLAVGELWLDHDLVFTTTIGTALDAANVRRYFRGICKEAGIGTDWAPRELRTSFVSLLSASGVPVEEIARLVGHSSSRTTETIYRKELRPVLVRGAEVMDQISGEGSLAASMVRRRPTVRFANRATGQRSNSNLSNWSWESFPGADWTEFQPGQRSSRRCHLRACGAFRFGRFGLGPVRQRAGSSAWRAALSCSLGARGRSAVESRRAASRPARARHPGW